jgi:hypothetical protein
MQWATGCAGTSGRDERPGPGSDASHIAAPEASDVPQDSASFRAGADLA